MPASVAVIILQYGNSEATLNCIRSVEQYNSYPIKYIVVDNASPLEEDREKLVAAMKQISDDDVSVVSDNDIPSKILPKATIVLSEKNDGYARGNNKGLKFAYADEEIKYILILNNDTLFVEDIIPQLVHDIETVENCALVSPLMYKKDLVSIDRFCARYEGRVRDTIVYNLLLFHIPDYIKRATFIPVKYGSGLKVVELISGSCIMCRKDLFEQIGSFDPNTFLYCEENILWEKIKLTGKVNYIDTDLKCIHLGAATTSKHFSKHLIQESFRSQNYFVKNYLPYGRIKVALLKLTNVWILTALTMRKLLLGR